MPTLNNLHFIFLFYYNWYKQSFLIQQDIILFVIESLKKFYGVEFGPNGKIKISF